MSAPHRVLGRSSLPGTDGGIELVDHEIEVPLDHEDPDGRTVRVFARELRSVAARKRLEVGAEQPALVYLQGGPGGRGIRPPAPGWLDKLLVDYRVVMLDQRGTGRSTPATARSLAGMLDHQGAQATADYLTHFRADAIVADAEALRRAVVGERPWTSFGQSYGGFVTLSYLSQAPDGLAECFITGGLPSPTASTRDIYEHTLTTTVATNATYFSSWPEDRAVLRRILDVLATSDHRLPNGVALTPRLFQTIGNLLGFRNGQSQLHVSLADAFAPSSGPGDADLLTDVFLGEVARQVSFADDPLYAVLHESIYAQGEATNWTAAGVLSGRPELAVDAADPCLLGEVIQPFFFDEDPALRPFADVARILAERSDWPRLYDLDRLARNEIPVYAAVYQYDLFVPAELSLRAVGEVANVHAWLTPDYLHDGIRDGDVVLDQLLAMASAHRVAPGLMPATVADLLGLLDLTPAGVDRFVGQQPATALQRVFGGQVAAQALTAATSTVPEREAGSTPVVHSLHAYFLRPGQTSKPITYEVERLRDGRAFATRRVQASQDDVPIFMAIVSFHVPEPGFAHADVMPDVPAAAACPTLGDILAGVSGRDPTAFLAEWDALEVRYVGDNRSGGVLEPDAHPARARLWIRTAGELPTDPAVHASVLTYASDLTLLGAALVPHGTYIGAPGLLVASIDHAMWFHRPVQADEWLLYDQISPSATSGLGFVTGRLFAADGELIASVAQEGLLRQTGSTSRA